MIQRKNWNRFSLAVVWLLLTLPVYAQRPAESFEEARFSTHGGVLNYRILYPENFSPNKKYPVLLFLHGAGERGSDNEMQLIHGSELFLDEDFRKNNPSVVIFPQCPRNDYWAQVAVDRTEMPLTLSFNYEKGPTKAMKLVMGLMDSIRTLPYSKDDQLYVGGLSMGGMGTYELLYRRPDMFAAAFPICGGGEPASVKAYADKVSLWVFHGGQDIVVLPSFSTDMVIALMKEDADVKYTLYKDANHNSWDLAFAEPELINWLFAQKRE